jgi:hypothetical protein
MSSIGKIRELEADDLRNQHRRWLAEHGRLRLDTTHAPAHHAETIDHRGVRVGAEQRIGEDKCLAVEILTTDDAGQVLDVHLMHDARARRHDPEVREGVLAPAEELVALAVALVLERHVEGKAVALAKVVDLHRMVDHQFHRLERIDARGIATELDHTVSHRRQVDDGRHTGEVLQEHARRHERDLALRAAGDVPPGQSRDVFLLDERPVFLAQQVLQQDAQRVRQPGHAGEPGGFEGWKAEEVDGLASDRESAARLEGI